MKCVPLKEGNSVQDNETMVLTNKYDFHSSAQTKSAKNKSISLLKQACKTKIHNNTSRWV